MKKKGYLKIRATFSLVKSLSSQPLHLFQSTVETFRTGASFRRFGH
jgi:hypothetical protein